MNAVRIAALPRPCRRWSCGKAAAQEPRADAAATRQAYRMEI